MDPIYKSVFANSDIEFYSVPSAHAPWPTYQQLLDSKQRLIVFMSNSVPSTSFPFLNPMWYSRDRSEGSIFQSPYAYYDPTDVRYLPTDKGQHNYTGSGDLGASLYLFNHFFYSDGFPIWTKVYGPFVAWIIHQFSEDFDFSDPTKNDWTVGETLRDHVVRAWSAQGANQRPNFVNVDFYQGVNNVQSILFDLIDWMNTIDHLEFV